MASYRRDRLENLVHRGKSLEVAVEPPHPRPDPLQGLAVAIREAGQIVDQPRPDGRLEPEQRLSERILFPATPSQSNGIEDARFVHFQNSNGSYVYYATFTAFDGENNQPYVSLTFNPKGADKFGRLTGRNVKRRMAILLDEKILSTPTIRSTIGARAQITGKFTQEEIDDLARRLRGGSLPVPLELLGESEIP